MVQLLLMLAHRHMLRTAASVQAASNPSCVDGGSPSLGERTLQEKGIPWRHQGLYSRALLQNPDGEDSHIYFANRSACHAKQEEWNLALSDATQCVIRKPKYARGWSRKGLAEFHLENHQLAMESYEKGLAIAPDDVPMQEGLSSVMAVRHRILIDMARDELARRDRGEGLPEDTPDHVREERQAKIMRVVKNKFDVVDRDGSQI